MYAISHEIYTQLAERLIERISTLHYFSGVIEFNSNQVDIRFVATLIPHFKKEQLPEREYLTLREITPVWWEMHTTTDEGECINDFDFTLFKGYICQ